MKKDNNNEEDIVARLVARLKQAEDMPYREGAWETFRDNKLRAPKRRRSLLPLWLGSAAAACLVCVFAAIWFINRTDRTKAERTIAVTQDDRNTDVPSPGQPMGEQVEDASRPVMPSDRSPFVGLPSLSMGGQQNVAARAQHSLQPAYVTAQEFGVSSVEVFAYKGLHNNSLYFPQVRFLPEVTDHTVNDTYAAIQDDLPSVFAQNQAVRSGTMNEVIGESKRFRFADKFNLGVVVAPSSTDQKVNFGGGLMLSYNVTKQLSVRTGATFHQYEVGALRDPINAAAAEVAAAPEFPLPTDLPAFSGAMAMRMPLIPNVNSISGMVRTIDIPVEAKYTFYKGLYAGVGISYAAVLNQQRFAHYIENVNANPFSNGLPGDERAMQQAVEPVLRTLESANENVDAAGFGGFVNMSVGKELKIRKGPAVSLEPYIKLPVGNFRRADMNYTNGGIRIITNF